MSEERPKKEATVSARLGRFALAAFEGNEGRAPWYKLIYTETDNQTKETKDRWVFLNQVDLAVLRELFNATAHASYPFGPLFESAKRG